MVDNPLPFTDTVAALPAAVPFVGPETLQRRRGAPFRARLGANESAFGVSPKAEAAMREAAADVAWYGDAESWELKQALAEAHGVPTEAIVIGAGIDGLLGVLVRAIVEPGTPVVTSHGAYPTFNYHVNGHGGRLEFVPYRDDREDWRGLAARAEAVSAPLVYFSNPDNPMGTWWPAAEVQQLIAAIPEGRILVLDEAYCDFAPPEALPPIDVTDRRVVRMRTFSKAHGMAGARIAYAITHPEIVTAFNKIRNHFEVNRMAQAGALASFHDAAFIRRVVEEVERGRQDYYATAARLGLKAIPSATNFVAIDMGRDGDYARAILSALQEDGVFIRMPGVAPLDRCIRVSVGRPEERAILDQALEAAIARVG
ncbi:pyridoxal phosphate-dependent aminotransferase [Marivibrio halodurans]|uniref:Pyridoxal phosphate-dependent aminotransferase n=1 Tax=Marivibrio halodurans TaxID=2039722 RepID=A0A8J7RXH4_9PROT|nr:pyridoxal phosphate-dependent aminotransferase [Marivibrio halodurans]MBP5856562.1 pyridoxal phosphate-dependent aminotransferase [Marivibrio halodurans]